MTARVRVKRDLSLCKVMYNPAEIPKTEKYDFLAAMKGLLDKSKLEQMKKELDQYVPSGPVSRLDQPSQNFEKQVRAMLQKSELEGKEKERGASARGRTSRSGGSGSVSNSRSGSKNDTQSQERHPNVQVPETSKAAQTKAPEVIKKASKGTNNGSTSKAGKKPENKAGTKAGSK